MENELKNGSETELDSEEEKKLKLFCDTFENFYQMLLADFDKRQKLRMDNLDKGLDYILRRLSEYEKILGEFEKKWKEIYKIIKE